MLPSGKTSLMWESVGEGHWRATVSTGTYLEIKQAGHALRVTLFKGGAPIRSTSCFDGLRAAKSAAKKLTKHNMHMS